MIRPFSNGTEFEMWDEQNCGICQNSSQNSDDNIYKCHIDEAMTNGQMLQQKLLNDAQRIDNIDLANEAKELERQISEYMSELQVYQNNIAAYSATVQEGVSIYGQEVQQAIAESQSLSALLQGLKLEYMELMQMINVISEGP